MKKIRAVFDGNRGLPKEFREHGEVHYIRDLRLTVHLTRWKLAR
jgi:hypothetical protein